MRIVLYNGELLKDYKARKRKRVVPLVMSVILAILMTFLGVIMTMAHWSEITGLFVKETPHAHEWQTSLQKAANCTDDGLSLRFCKSCGEEERTFLSAHGHRLMDNTCVDCGKKTSSGLEFKLCVDDDGEGYVRIDGIGECLERDIVLPLKIGGFPVREIKKNAFEGNLQIRSVAIHDGVQKIGANAFANCKNLYTILLPAGLDENAFFGVFHNTAYTNDVNNWQDNALYRQGYLLESLEETTNV